LGDAVDRINAAIIGSGNIGTDLLYKALRSRLIQPLWMVGIDAASDGLRRAREHGLRTTELGVDELLPFLLQDKIRVAFDATSAHAHADTAHKLHPHGVMLFDLTPAALGPYCIPPVNMEEHLRQKQPPLDINMVSCGAQATVPMVAAIRRVQPVEYAEIVATVASKSVGPGTRQNIDEFTRVTASAIEKVGGARRGKAIIIINPAEPPLVMRDTIHCLTAGPPRQDEITASIAAMLKEMQRYVPAYKLKTSPVFEGRRVTVYVEVQGLGDYLPKYAGNLDIMTAAAIRAAEMFAEEMLGGVN